MITYNLISAPANEPVSLADAKAWLKIDGTDEDLLVSALVTSARLAVETVTGLMLITQTWRLTLDQWPCSNVLLLTHAPLQSVQALRIYDASGTASLQPLSSISVLSFMREPRLSLNANLPGAGRTNAGIALDLVFGYGDSATSVPEPIKLAIKLLTAFWHENRGDDASNAAVKWPESISALLQPYMLRRL